MEKRVSEALTRSVRLYGTDEPVTPPRMLRAAALTAELESGNLRSILRQCRDDPRCLLHRPRQELGHLQPAISKLRIDENADGFRVAYNAVAKDAVQEFAYSAEIVGGADGMLGAPRELMPDRSQTHHRLHGVDQFGELRVEGFAARLGDSRGFAGDILDRVQHHEA
jgi:hypothetical protein